MFGDDGFDAFDAGTIYALARHGQDVQTQQLLAGLRAHDDDEPIEVSVDVHLHPPAEENPRPPVNALDFTTVDLPDDFDDYIGQKPAKNMLAVYIAEARENNAALPHVLLASGYPGIGKTTLARLIAKVLGVKIWEVVPPFNIFTLVAAAQKLGDRDILFIDEIHKLADNGPKGTEILLKVLEDKVAYMPDGEVIRLRDITVIGATTEKDRLLETVVDRFPIPPYLQPYSKSELAEIAVVFAFRYECEDIITDRMAVDIAKACRGTPRIIGQMVKAARALNTAIGRPPTTQELLAFLEVEPDGLTRTHIQYITAMRQYFARRAPKAEGEGIEYIVGEAAIQQILRETKPGLQRIEGFLVERGLVDRTPRGRRLTELGIARAEEFIRAGKGAANIG